MTNRPQPHPALRTLEPLIGTWELRGRYESGEEIRGKLVRSWMEGGFYLVQQVDIEHPDHPTRGIEYVGYDEAQQNLRSYCFSEGGPGPFGRVALEYVWQLEGTQLVIWGGDVGSPAAFRGELSADGRTVTGRWKWPGGGYEATITRAG